MEEFKVELFPALRELSLFGHTLRISPTVLTTWGIIAAVLVLAVLFRLLVVPRMTDRPRGIQLAVESIVDTLDGYIGSKLRHSSLAFGGYMLSLALLLVASALVELFGLRAPTSDITMTLALSLITFFMINYYGFKQRGFLGRLRSLGGIERVQIPPGTPLPGRLRLRLKNLCQPSVIGFPFRVISDLVVPLSLTCRLFGNMFGGMIIIELLYFALGRFAIGLPSVAGLYFNVFHPLIQAFIFITLSLSYIEEATEG